MPLSLDILPPPQRALWDELIVPTGFVLYGGTAIALRLGHRHSDDFDFFCTTHFVPEELFRALVWARGAEVVQSNANTLTLRVERGGAVKVSFFGGLSISQLAPPELALPSGLWLASLGDLLATKLKVIVQRSEAKGYLDIAALLDAGLSLDSGLGGAAALFGRELNPALPLRALAWFEDGDLPRLPGELKEQLTSAAADIRRIPAIPRQSERIGS